jgi:ribosomal-protein-serine acetyltransferase
VIDFHHLRTSQGTAEIGYWLAAGHQGKGLMTKACRALIDYGFGTLGLRRIAIQCATGNTRSQAIPERLGFTREGVLREVMIVNGSPIDHAVYAMLARDWALDR